MTSIPAEPQTFVQPSLTARDPRVAAAVKAVPSSSFAPLANGAREMPAEATVRMLEDLHVTDESRVLIVEPFSGYLPELLGRLAAEVTAVCADPSRAQVLREQMADVGAANVQVQTFVQDREDDERGFDRMVVMQPANEELGPVLQGLLAEHGRAVWSVDKSMPPRRLRRLLCIGSSVKVEEDLDLVHFMPLLGDMLVDRGVALRQEVADAVAAAKGSGRMLGQELLERGSVREVDLFAVLAEQQGFSFVTAADILPHIDGDLVRQLPRKYLDYHQFLPVCSENGKVRVVTPDVNLPVDEVRSVFDDAEVTCELISPTDLQRVWAVIELGLLDQADRGSAGKPRDGGRRIVAGQEVAGHETVAGSTRGQVCADERASGGPRFDAVLADALALGATDVHFEPAPDGARVRYRVHGRMVDAPVSLSGPELGAIAVAVEQASGTSWTIGGEEVQLLSRVHHTLAGPGVTVRRVDDGSEPMHLEALGMSAGLTASFREALAQPRGLVLVAGPTRSGRSTSIRAGIQECLGDRARKAVAVVAEHVSAVPCVATVAAADHTDAAVAGAIRGALRQDADVLFVDASCGAEAMAELVRAAHRGALVVVAADGNDFAEALQGVLDLGIANRTLANVLVAVLVQHLSRSNCATCREPSQGSNGRLADVLPDDLAAPGNHFEGAGCQHCHETGFEGQVPVVEFVANSSSLRGALRRGVAPHDLSSIARESGMQSLYESAVELLQNGELSLDEFDRALTAEQCEGHVGGRSAGTCS